jgi:hypothetical protein
MDGFVTVERTSALFFPFCWLIAFVRSQLCSVQIRASERSEILSYVEGWLWDRKHRAVLQPSFIFEVWNTRAMSDWFESRDSEVSPQGAKPVCQLAKSSAIIPNLAHHAFTVAAKATGSYSFWHVCL